MKGLTVNYYKHKRNIIPSSFAFQRINFYELTICFRGELNYTVNDVDYTLTDGDIVFLMPNSVRNRKKNNQTADYLSFNFFSDEEILLPTFIKNGLSSLITMIIATIDSIKDKNSHMEEIALLLECIITSIEKEIANKNQNQYVEKIKKYLQYNYSKKITLKEIAENVSLSPNYADAIFSKETGKYIFDYLGDIRIQEAKRQIIENNKKLNEIAYDLGFENYNYFSRYFKKKTGISPSNFKKSFYK